MPTITVTPSFPSDIAFGVYSINGRGADGPLGGKAISQGDILEMVAPGNLVLYYDNITGTSTSDVRRISFMTDYGERYEAQHLEHEYLPSGFTTRDPTGATLGLVPGYVSGHAHRGTSMAGAQLLTDSYTGGAGPTGTIDQTVTCTVSDGTNSTSMSFTVRLIHPHKYYADQQGTTYGTSANMATAVDGDRGNRRGIFYVSRTDDFTGAPVGPKIFHMVISDGDIAPSYFRSGGLEPTKLYDTSTGTPVNVPSFNPGWGNVSITLAVYLKTGQTWLPRLASGPMGSANSYLGSWGGGLALLDGEKARTWDPGPLEMFKSTWVGYMGQRHENLDYMMSEYTVSDIEWREWWNILPYTNKTGTFGQNTNGDVRNGFNGEIITNAGNTAYAQIIGDTGTELIVRQVVNLALINSDDAVNAAFANGDILTGGTSGATCTFVIAGSRQNRTRKTPPTGWAFSSTAAGVVFDRCVFRGGRMNILNTPNWSVYSDVLNRDYWDYGVFAESLRFNAHNAMVTVCPSSYEGGFRNYNSGVSPNRTAFNTMSDNNPSTPIPNEVVHAAQRYVEIGAVSLYKCGQHAYGGHGSNYQPGLRMGTQGSNAGEGLTYVYQHGCFYSGSNVVMQITTRDVSTFSPRTPKGWVMDNCWLRGDFSSVGYLTSMVTSMGIKNCRIGHPAGVTMKRGSRDVTFIAFTDGFQYDIDPDMNPIPSFVEDNTFEFNANVGLDVTGREAGTTVNILGYDTSIREVAVTYARNTVDVDETKVNDVATFP